MKKALSAICMVILGAAFTFAQQLGESEKNAIRTFFEEGCYIECSSPSGEFTIIKKQSVVSVQDKKNSTILIVTDNGSTSVEWKSIKSDSSGNLKIKIKNPGQDQAASHKSSDAGPKYSDGGKVLTIYSWNDEFMNRLQNFYPGYDPKTDRIGDVKINWVIKPAGDEYLGELDEALSEQNEASSENKIDLFLIEADYALKYTDSPRTLDIKADLGFTDENLSKQFRYTKDIGTADGKLKALTWQGCPGGMLYRRSIAKEVFGTDDPDKIQELLSDWEKFNKAAEKAKAKGYFMVSGTDDTYRVFSDNRKTPWVIDGEINIDDSINEWISQQKEFSENGCHNNADLWSYEQFLGAQKYGKVFCYFGPSWFIDYVIEPQSESTSGDWAFCKGPQGFFWGGSWICAATGTDNISIVKDIMEKLTTDDKIMERIIRVTGDFVNNENVMKAIAEDSKFEKKFLGGQNPFRFFIESAKSVDKSNITIYDADIDRGITAAMKNFFNGRISEGNAWENFYEQVMNLHPNLTRPED
ncbi:MAG: carbohydrate ABC transporter substrate-binding protein [Treponema sp.]|nr:carbohydrate ABC transporter substrate-binding protein [Treponema sp.]MBQ5384490.1 carbohydrate ABC transporter substrate-binding protein [Treponema sp.]